MRWLWPLLVVALALPILLTVRAIDARLPPDPGRSATLEASLLQRFGLRAGLGAVSLGGLALIALLVDPRGVIDPRGVALAISFALVGALPAALFACAELIRGRVAGRRTRVATGAVLGLVVGAGGVVLAYLHTGYVIRALGTGPDLEVLAAKGAALLAESPQDLALLFYCTGVPAALALAATLAVDEPGARWALVIAGGLISWPLAVPFAPWGDAWVAAAMVFAFGSYAIYVMEGGAPVERRLWGRPPEEEPPDLADPPTPAAASDRGVDPSGTGQS